MTDWHAHVTVATVIEDEGKFLLVEEHSPEGLVFNQPAGHLEPGESLEDAAIRETLEETGWHIALDGLLGLALYTAPANGVTYHRTTFAGRALHRDPDLPLDDGIVRAVWMSPEEIRAHSARMRSPLVLTAVEQYRQGKLIPLDFIYCSA